MKKYSRVRLGLHKVPVFPNVTPTGRHAISYNEDCWKSKPEEQQPPDGSSKLLENTPTEIGRSSEGRQSKAKRVKNYLKKCKNAIGNKISSSEASTSNNEDATLVEKDSEVILNKSEVNELNEIYENLNQNACLQSVCDLSEVANVVNIINENGDDLNTKSNVENSFLLDTHNKLQSPFLTDAQETVDSKNINDEENVLCKDVTE
ncbi:hypothetical protein RN001_009880, partial [Aquatica leii]